MGIMRRGSGRPSSVRRNRSRLQGLEVLESRQLLASNLAGYGSPYIPSDLYVRNPITNQREMVSASALQQPNNPNGPLVSNQGKIVSGMDRAGNAVHDHRPRPRPGDRDRHHPQRRRA